MAKDYAKRVFTTTPRKSKKKRFRRELVLSLILLVVCFLSYEAFKQRNELFLAENSWLARAKGWVSHKGTNKSAQLAKTKTATQEQVAPAVHFDFYSELPKMQVTVSEPTAPENPAPTKKINGYIVEFGLFKDEVSAGQLRLSLLLSGIEADIAHINTRSGTVFRVQYGPFSSQAETKKFQRQFQKKGMMGVVKQV